MNIEISLNNPNSIENAIKALNNAKNQIPLMIQDFLMACCVYFYDKANEYIRDSDIGESVKQNIISKWELPLQAVFHTDEKGRTGYIARIVNTDDQAVFVEFGVGEVGELFPHENAKLASYKYDVESEYKHNGQWIFQANDEADVDLEYGMYKSVPNKYGNLWIITKGSPSVMYAYNALLDLQLYAINNIWQQIKIKYWG